MLGPRTKARAGKSKVPATLAEAPSLTRPRAGLAATAFATPTGRHLRVVLSAIIVTASTQAHSGYVTVAGASDARAPGASSLHRYIIIHDRSGPESRTKPGPFCKAASSALNVPWGVFFSTLCASV